MAHTKCLACDKKTKNGSRFCGALKCYRTPRKYGRDMVFYPKNFNPLTSKYSR